MDVPSPDPRFRELTAATLAGLSADEVGGAVLQHVRHRVRAQPERQEEIVRALPAGVRAIYATYLVDADVNSGGFARYFLSPAHRFAGDALAAYELLEAEDYAMVMRSAIATFEADRDLFMDPSETSEVSAARASAALDELDQRYYALGDRIYNVWAGFVRSRPELFVSSA
jgi:hypothetical protein